MFELVNVSMSFAEREVLRDISCLVRADDRIGLVGPNGAGKSTLLKILAGHLDPEKGDVRVDPGRTVAYLSQLAPSGSPIALWSDLESVFAPVYAVQRRLDELSERMTGLAADDPRLEAYVHEQADLHAEFERLDGHTVEARIGETLAGLGFQEADYRRPLGTFSGGWQMRAALARVLLQAPDLLLLDEPTNHLDIAATEWLEQRLRSYRGAVVVVSHDRYFLDRATNRTFALENGALRDHVGGYSSYILARKAEQETQESAYRRQQEYLSKQMATVERFRASATRSRQAKSREKMLDRIERVERPKDEAEIRFSFPPAPPSAGQVLRLRDVAKRYGDKTVLAGVTMTIELGDRIGLVGPNGAGKSTLLRVMARVEVTDFGQVLLGENVRPSYFAQDQADRIEGRRSVIDELQTAAPLGATNTWLRGLLARFLIRQEAVFKPVASLSGGERSRLALAKLLLKPTNLLLLDEPTNHLDLASREVLEEALLEYDGTLVIASHDRYLLDRLATKIVDVGNGVCRVYEGNYSAYHAKKETERLTPSPEPRAANPASETIDRKRPSKSPDKSKPVDRQRVIATLEARIAELEQRQIEITEMLGSNETYGDPTGSLALLDEYTHVEQKLAAAMAEWEKHVT